MKKVFDNFKDKISNINKLNISINKEKYIFLGIISIFLVVILLMGNTYSLFKSSNVDEDLHVYKTGVLEVTYTLSDDNVMIDTKSSTSLEDSEYINPYRLIVTNTGSVAYKFNVVLSNTTASNVINSQYIMTKVGKLEHVSLDNCTNNIIKGDVIVPAGDQVIVDVRVWLSDTVQNTEIGKSFYAKLSIDGLAVYNENDNIDNSDLRADYPLLSEVEPGSYVKYIGNNGCIGDSCSGVNANSSSTSNGYCRSSSYEFKTSGWRVAYVKNNNAYLVSAGSPECLCTSSDGTMSNDSSGCAAHEETVGLPLHMANLDSASLKYCNAGYASSSNCANDSVGNFDAIDFQNITGSELYYNSSTDNSCSKVENSVECGYGNDLIFNGSYYWIATPLSTNPPHAFGSTSGSMWINDARTDYSYGLRPTIKLDPSIEIIGGKGIENDPYIIENPNTIKDLSGNMNNGVPVNSKWNEKAGTVTTNGVDGYVNMGLKNYDFGDSVSFVTRMKFNTLTSDSDHYIFGNWQGAGGGLWYSALFNELYFEVLLGTSWKQSIYSISLNIDTWYTMVGTYDGSNVKLYLDGNLVTTLASTGNIKVTDMPFLLGANPATSDLTVIDGYTNATFDYALLYDRAITQEEVTANFAGGEINSNNISKDNLLIHYNFGSDTTEEDDTVYLNEVESGSYVKYIGNNGCTGDSCSGVNANSNSTSNGYCHNLEYPFTSSGWRVAHTDSTNAYLISGGSPECVCTNSDGSISNSSCSSNLAGGSTITHINNLNARALNYCNVGFSHNSICDNNSSWSINDNDYKKITTSSFASCETSNNTELNNSEQCGYNNSIIDNRTYYWFSGINSNTATYSIYYWSPHNSYLGYTYSRVSLGLRPVIKLDPMVEVVGGKGTEEDPYIIENPNTIKDLSGNMNNGALINNPIWNKTKGKLTTNGVDNYVNMGLKKYDFGDSVAIATRIKFNSINEGITNSIINNQNAAGITLHITASAKLSFGVHVNGAYYYYSSNYVVDENIWYTIVGSYDGTNLALYINNELVELDTSIATSTTTLSGVIKPSSLEFHLGNNPESDGSFIYPSNVTFDYVLIYDRGITHEEVINNFSGNTINNSTLDRTDLLIYYDFEG